MKTLLSKSLLTLAVGLSLHVEAAEMSDGEVRKVDKAQAKVTIKHGELKSLDMPPMTMVYVLRDKAALDTLKPGDKVKFVAIKDGGTYTVTEIKVVP